MARRIRNFRGLSGSPEHHQEMVLESGRKAKAARVRVEKDVAKGRCFNAMKSLVAMATARGEAAAHFAELSPLAKRGIDVEGTEARYYRDRPDMAIPDMFGAETDFMKCLVGGGLSGMRRRRR